jgi:hypothetical protein
MINWLVLWIVFTRRQSILKKKPIHHRTSYYNIKIHCLRVNTINPQHQPINPLEIYKESKFIIYCMSRSTALDMDQCPYLYCSHQH